VVVEAVEHILEHEPELTPAQATEKAMGQVTGPIIAITLVLLSVFIPTMFIPGISGKLYEQFAVAVSVSMIISAINALTLSPALCSLILRHRKKPRGVMAWMQNGIDKSRDRLCPPGDALARRGVIALLLVAGFVVATGGIGALVPSASCRTRTRAPSWPRFSFPMPPRPTAPWPLSTRSRRRSRESRGSRASSPCPATACSTALTCQTVRLVVAALKPFDERKDRKLSVFHALEEVNLAFTQIASANIFAFTCRRSWGWAILQVSSSSFSRWPARHRPSSPPWRAA